MKNIKRVAFAGLLVILFSLFSLAGVFALRTMTTKVKPAYPAYQMGAKACNEFIYIKDFDTVRDKWLAGALYQQFKNNYVYLDYKYKYFETINNYLVRFNFNIEKLLKIVHGDLLVGRYNSSNYCVIAQLDLEAKYMLSILNIIPETQVVKSRYGTTNYYTVKKGSGSIYYAQLGEYVAFCTSMNQLTWIIDGYNKHEIVITHDLYDEMADNGAFIKMFLPVDYAKFGILPRIDSLDIMLDLDTLKAKIMSNTKNAGYMGKSAFSYREALKYLPQNLPLCTYNGTADVYGIITSIMGNETGKPDKNNGGDPVADMLDKSEVLDDYNNGVVFMVNSFGIGSDYGEPEPQLGFMIMPDKALDRAAYVQNGTRLRDLAGSLLGIEQWDAVSGAKYMQWSNSSTGFTVISTERAAGIFTGDLLPKAIVSQISSQGQSLYDLVYGKGVANSQKQSCMIYLNNEALVNDMEPTFIDYLQKDLSVNSNDYDNSFGGLFDYLKKKPPYFIEIARDSNDGYYNGVAEYLN